ncbi:MAG TPA: hydantoinase/oxoprolinase family protein [Dissulfurispiraceae bacterium]|nr:hydantoinase/oxoprolinase family protein [Dissulfurispiraceae bacterium]
MRVGLDVGGTHTDAVVVDTTGIVCSAKVPTNHSNLISSVMSALINVLGAAPSPVSAVHLSTTLTTNALLEGKTEPVGVLVSSGPGIHPLHHRIGDAFFVVDGALDHRGAETLPLDAVQLGHALSACREREVRCFAVVSKFSPRNAAHEKLMAAALAKQSDFVTSGHMLGGRLNFPRRIATAYFNSAVWRTYNCFADAVEKGLLELGMKPGIAILKADGGTMPFAVSRSLPVQSILSGPAASIMGITALCDIHGDAVLLDIGGTSTDIAVVAGGAPLLVPDGIGLNGRQTLVRAMVSSSLAVGGDSALRASADGVSVGPDRCGPCMALGGSVPTLMDACNYGGLSHVGSLESSHRGMAALARQLRRDTSAVAREAVSRAVTAIKAAVDTLVGAVNEKPVYTVREMLHPERIVPRKIYMVGGPAHALSDAVSSAFNLDVFVPEQHAVANAIGAALARRTCDLELFADTERGVKLIPRLSRTERIDRSYALDHAKDDARQALLSLLAGESSADVEIVEASSFNMIQGGRLAGKNIRVQCQLRPGIQEAYLSAFRRGS